MAAHPALLSRNLTGWSSGRIAPSFQKDSAAKQNWKCMLVEIVYRFSGKLQKVMKLGKMLLIKLVSYYLLDPRWVLGQFPENLKINGTPWENDFALISWTIVFRKLSANSRRMFRIFLLLPLINYLLTGLFVLNTKPSLFLRTDLVSLVHTSKSRA